ncbi:unnamed protein product [Orchesella dallaii]|uniref:Uncharacterized protein n=1 Tax=Orchesella dallaii TaxID=48710 RepID=A0ABP1S5D1_9HEXA
MNLSSSEHKRLREVSFTNIQKHLLQRGVDLKRTYPDIFMKLCRYVEQDEPFLPVTIYPKNTQTGRQFVCIIMPESSDSAYTAATQESGQGHPLQRVETINISEQDEQDIT